MRGTSEHPQTYKRRLYKALLTSIQAAAGFPELRVQKIWHHVDWVRIWKNLNDAPVPANTRCIWYQVVHNIIPTKVGLHRINMVPSDTCQRCTATDTLEHRLIACGEGRAIWQYTKTLLARILRKIPARIPDDWALRPQFYIWPPKRHRANITGGSKRQYLQNSTAYKPDLTRLHGFPTQIIQMEIDAPQRCMRPCRQLPNRPRHILMDLNLMTKMCFMT